MKCIQALIIQGLTESFNNISSSGRESFLPDFLRIHIDIYITIYLVSTKLTINISRYLPMEYMNHIYKYFLRIYMQYIPIIPLDESEYTGFEVHSPTSGDAYKG